MQHLVLPIFVSVLGVCCPVNLGNFSCNKFSAISCFVRFLIAMLNFTCPYRNLTAFNWSNSCRILSYTIIFFARVNLDNFLKTAITSAIFLLGIEIKFLVAFVCRRHSFFADVLLQEFKFTYILYVRRLTM